jgi:paraquat-inducible protein B
VGERREVDDEVGRSYGKEATKTSPVRNQRMDQTHRGGRTMYAYREVYNMIRENPEALLQARM